MLLAPGVSLTATSPRSISDLSCSAMRGVAAGAACGAAAVRVRSGSCAAFSWASSRATGSDRLPSETL